MTDAIAPGGAIDPDTFGWFVFAFLRVGCAFYFVPVFGSQMVPRNIRLGMALGMTVIVAPVLSGIHGDAPRLSATALLTEMLTGLAIAFFLRLFTIALEILGAMASQSVSLAQLFGSQGLIDPQSAMARVILLAGLTLLTLSGIHVKICNFFVLSYAWAPVASLPAATDLTALSVSHVTHAFNLAFRLAAPFVLVAVLYNLTLGVVNKAMPQLMVAFIGAPAISLIGLSVLFVSLPYSLEDWAADVDLFLSGVLEVPLE